MGRKKIVTHNRLVKAIENSNGIVKVIAKRLNVEWHTAKTAIQNDKEALVLFQNECEQVSDDAETVILKSINRGNVETAKWYLTQKARDRGYGDPLPVEDKHDEIILNFTDGKDYYENGINDKS